MLSISLFQYQQIPYSSQEATAVTDELYKRGYDG